MLFSHGSLLIRTWIACEDWDYGKYDLTNDNIANLKYNTVTKTVATE